VRPGRLVIRFLIILALGAGISLARPASAQQDLASELVALVNALRASYGLAPYTVDAGLMAIAQAHSQYQASIHQSTHQHSDGSGPPQLGVVENVAGGDFAYIDAQAVVYEIWADPVHMRTMTGYASGAMGVGVADDGETVYVTLEVVPGERAAKATGSAETRVAESEVTPVAPTPLVSMTPRLDGSIVHVVGYGQTLWEIALAYGATVDQLRAWNNLPEGSSDIYAGQKLLVRPAGLALPSETPAPGAATADAATAVPSTGRPAEVSTVSPSPVGTNIASAAAAGTDTPKPLTAAGLENASAPGEVQPSANTRTGGPGGWVPLAAGGSILLGAAVLAILFVRLKKER
jgi:LysM repeat protein